MRWRVWILVALPFVFAGCTGSASGRYATDTYGPSFYDPYRADVGGWSSMYGLAPYRDGFDFGAGHPRRR